MTDQQLDLDAIEARAAALNQLGILGGTWTASLCDEKSVLPPEQAHVVEDVLQMGGAKLRSSVGVFGDPAHAEFVAHARKDVGAMAEEIRRLRNQVTELEAGIAWRDAERRRWVDVQNLVERAIDKGWSTVDTLDLEAELGPALPAAEEVHVVADDSDDLLHVDPTPDTDTNSCHWTDCPLDEGHDGPHDVA